MSDAITGEMTVASLTQDFDFDINVEDDGTVTVNGVAVTAADIPATNGVIHSIEGVLLPACVSNDMLSVLSDDPTFSDLVNLAKASGVLSFIEDQEPTAEGVTIFVPTNDAIGQIDSVALAGLAATNMDAVVGILEYHILPFNYDGVEDGKYTTMQGEDISVHRESDGTLEVNQATVLRGPILASDGVIYVIDGPLIPPSLAG